MLQVKDIHLGYAQLLVVRGVSLRLAKGEIGCLLGASGCGKTTLLRAIAGFEPLRSGGISLGGRAIEHLAPQERDIGMVFQDHALFPHLSVAGNIGFGLPKRGKTAQEQERVQEMLSLVGLEGMSTRWPHQLSGGQQQRVALARALAPAPGLLVLDEPFSSLDTSMREAIAQEVRSILKKTQTTALMVTHDQNEAFAIADNIGVMAAGRLMHWGTATEVYAHPASIEVARFVGEGVLLSATPAEGGAWSSALGILPPNHPHYSNAQAQSIQVPVQVLVRPEQVVISAPENTSAQCLGRVVQRTFRGSHFIYALELLESGQSVLAQALLHQDYAVGEKVALQLKL